LFWAGNTPKNYTKRRLSSWISQRISVSYIKSAADRNRTGTKFNPRRILSPVRLPVPPLRLVDGEGFEPFWFWTINISALFSAPQWMEKDSNLRRRCQQIYSLPPLATRESIHTYHVRNDIRSDKIYLYHIFRKIAS